MTRDATESLTTPEESPLFVASLAKGLSLLACFSPQHPTMGLPDLANRVGLNKSTVQRAAYTLETLGYLFKDPDTKHYQLAPKVLELGMGFVQTSEIVGRANPYLHELNRNTQESCNLLSPWHDDMIYVARFASHKQISIHIPLGQKLPMYCTAAGRAYLSGFSDDVVYKALSASDRRTFTLHTVTDLDQLMAQISQARQRGYATSYEEIYAGDLSVAACVINADGQPIAAVNISVPNSRWSPATIESELAPQLLSATHSISSAARGVKGTFAPSNM